FYMHQRYNHYIADFNGQYYGSQRAVSEDFMNTFALNTGQREHDKAINKDHRDFRSGVGLQFLADQLLRAEVVDSIAGANWFTQALALNYPTERRYVDDTIPMSREDIELRCMNLYVGGNVLSYYSEQY